MIFRYQKMIFWYQKMIFWYQKISIKVFFGVPYYTADGGLVVLPQDFFIYKL